MSLNKIQLSALERLIVNIAAENDITVLEAIKLVYAHLDQVLEVGGAK